MAAARQPLPKEVQDRPVPDFDAELYWTAFWQLATTRVLPAPIGWHHIHLWATAHRLFAHEVAELTEVVRELDLVYLAHWRKAQPKDGGRGNNGNGRQRT